MNSEIDEVDVSDFYALQLKYNLRTDNSKNQVKTKIWKYFENMFAQSAP